MANFDKGNGIGGSGFNSSAYALTLPLDNRRAVALLGGGPAGEALTVGAADTSKVRIVERTATRSGDPLPSGSREFWVDGIGVGTTTLFARLADGRDYSKPLAVNISNTADKVRMVDAFRTSRDTLVQAIRALRDLQKPVIASQFNPPSTRLFNRSPVLNTDQLRVMTAVAKWLNVPNFDPKLGPTEYKAWATQVSVAIIRAVALMQDNLNLRMDVFVRVPEGVHAQVFGGSLGVECGEPFFSTDGPHCRRDVLTHELFHQLGVGHGIDPLSGPTIHRFGITTSQSLNSADNLAQLVADIVGASTDCCTRPGD